MANIKKGCGGNQLTDMDYLPRSILGEYLGMFFNHLLSLLPENVDVIVHKANAIDISNENPYKIELDNNNILDADFIFLTTGHVYRKPSKVDQGFADFAKNHCHRNRNLAYYQTPYPIGNLDCISSNATVLIQGFGLTAHDTISALTIGRGGHFEEDGNKLRYCASGSEPDLRLVSRQCLPFAARGTNQKGLTGRHQSQFFTLEAITKLRQQAIQKTGDYRLNFQKDVMPLILKEVIYAWRCAKFAKRVDPRGFQPTKDEINSINKILWPLEGNSFSDFSNYRAFFKKMVDEDLLEAVKGNMNSAVKASTDVLRDTRDVLRSVIEFGGLLPESHKYFIEHFNPIINRVSFGPPLRRVKEVQALFEAGVLDLAGGPGAMVITNESTSEYEVITKFANKIYKQKADIVISARLDGYSPLTDSSRLTENLLKRSLIRPWMNGDYHPGGVDIDKHMHPIDSSGKPQPRLWAIGFPVEGAHYYTHALPRPHVDSRQITEAENCVVDCLKQITEIHKRSQQLLETL